MDVEDKKSFLVDWNELVCSKNSIVYNENLHWLHARYGQYNLLLKYVHEQWLDPFKDIFVQMWTDECMHFGNYTSNEYLLFMFLFYYVSIFSPFVLIINFFPCRAESAHSKLKKHLATC